MSKTVEELQQEYDELMAKNQEQQKQLERMQIEKDAAEALLKGVEFGRDNKNNSFINNGKLRDASGNANLRTIIEDGSKNDTGEIDFEKEVDKATQEILASFTDEQLQDPSVQRTIYAAFGKRIGVLAFRRAVANAISVFQTAVTVKSNIDAVIENWRRKNPKLANREMEDLVEAFLLRHVAPDPMNKGKSLDALLDLATDKVKEFFKLKGIDVESDGPTRAANLTLSPSKGSGGGGSGVKKNKEEVDLNELTPEQQADRYLESRRKLFDKKKIGSRIA